LVIASRQKLETKIKRVDKNIESTNIEMEPSSDTITNVCEKGSIRHNNFFASEVEKEDDE
jgi:hypothetical protein